jgi:hypothetical protein
VNSAFSPVFTAAHPAIRRFQRGSTLAYAYTVYNPKAEKGTPPTLTRQIKLFLNGQLVVESGEKPLTSAGGAGAAQINDRGELGLGESVEFGEYVLQVIVRDKASGKVSSQWIDFEIIQ